jgi:hypothetical protein
MYNMEEKYAKHGKGKVNPFIDPQGYKAELDLEEGVFPRRTGEGTEGSAVIALKRREDAG